MADAAAIQGVYSCGRPRPILSTRMNVMHTEVMNTAGKNVTKYQASFFSFSRCSSQSSAK